MTYLISFRSRSRLREHKKGPSATRVGNASGRSNIQFVLELSVSVSSGDVVHDRCEYQQRVMMEGLHAEDLRHVSLPFLGYFECALSAFRIWILPFLEGRRRDEEARLHDSYPGKWLRNFIEVE